MATNGKAHVYNRFHAQFVVRNLTALDGIMGHLEGDKAYVINDGTRYIHDDTQTLFPLHWRKVEDHD